MKSKSKSLLQTYLDTVEALVKNEDQRQAFLSEGNCVILAGPGSGKTRVLTAKLASLLQSENHEGVACITYSAECARELTRRLSEYGVYEDEDVYVGTLHSFSLRFICRPFLNLYQGSLPNTLKVAGEHRRDLALQAAMDQVMTEQPPPLSEYRTTFEFYRRTFLDRDSHEWTSTNAETARIIEVYEERLHREGYVDFDDIILNARRIINESKTARDFIRAKFPVVFVDEYQDLGRSLNDMVIRLAQDAGVRIVAVGDPDQSIYGFVGADPALLEDLGPKLGVDPIRLRINYRSRKVIVDGSQILLDTHRDYRSFDSTDDGVIDFIECVNGIEQQAEQTR